MLLLGMAARLPDAVGNGCEAAVLLLGMTGRLLAVVGNTVPAIEYERCIHLNYRAHRQSSWSLSMFSDTCVSQDVA